MVKIGIIRLKKCETQTRQPLFLLHDPNSTAKTNSTARQKYFYCTMQQKNIFFYCSKKPISTARAVEIIQQPITEQFSVCPPIRILICLYKQLQILNFDQRKMQYIKKAYIYGQGIIRVRLLLGKSQGQDIIRVRV